MVLAKAYKVLLHLASWLASFLFVLIFAPKPHFEVVMPHPPFPPFFLVLFPILAAFYYCNKGIFIPLNAVDFLLKPFDFERFKKAVDKAIEYQAFVSGPKSRELDTYIFVKSEYKAVKINLSDILYIEGMDSYVKIYAGGKPILTLMPMKTMLEMLPQKEFIRVHRSFIVPVAKVQSIRNKQITIGEKQIPVGGTYEDVIEKLLRSGGPGIIE